MMWSLDIPSSSTERRGVQDAKTLKAPQIVVCNMVPLAIDCAFARIIQLYGPFSNTKHN